MRYLVFISCFLICCSCTSSYKSLRTTKGNTACIQKYKPDFSAALYKTQVDVLNKHLSGLLLIKTMPDSSLRIVFSSETGFKFFDFEFSPAGKFKVYYIIKQMNKKAVIITLRKDFELVLMTPSSTQNGKVYYNKNDQYNYYRFPEEKGFNYYITDSICTQLIRMERASKRKPVMQAIMQDYNNEMPDTIGISHTNFKFTIGLKKLDRNAAE